ncbi:MAG: squalene--hopene cyclase [Thermoguttaceae bacterium]|jgi:squalene-hopene/tetraprenyl-beta-curcumene cyclase
MRSSVLFGCTAFLTPWLAVVVAYGGEADVAKPSKTKMAGELSPVKSPQAAADTKAAPAREKLGRANEPCLKRLSLSKAADYLDAAVHAHESNCLACHGTFAYLAARPAIATMTSTHRRTRQILEEFAAKQAGAKLSPRDTPQLDVSEAVLTAAVLAQHDAATERKLLPLTRKALDQIWDLQRDDGGWNWVKHDEPPSGIDDHFGVTMAAIAVGTAPDRYADTPQARKGLDRIRHYLREHPPANMHQRAILLLAAAGVEGLLTREQLKQSVADLFALQKADGGWAMASLGDWKRVDGAPLDRAVSDGYGTGFAVYVLRRGGRIAADDPRLSKGLLWLKTHQRTSGCWFTRSPYKNDEVSTYAGTAYAILALDACGEIPLQHD